MDRPEERSILSEATAAIYGDLGPEAQRMALAALKFRDALVHGESVTLTPDEVRALYPLMTAEPPTEPK